MAGQWWAILRALPAEEYAPSSAESLPHAVAAQRQPAPECVLGVIVYGVGAFISGHALIEYCISHFAFSHTLSISNS